MPSGAVDNIRNNEVFWCIKRITPLITKDQGRAQETIVSAVNTVFPLIEPSQGASLLETAVQMETQLN